MKRSPFILTGFLFLILSCKQQASNSSGISPEFIFRKEYQQQWKGSADLWHWENETLSGETTEDHPIKKSAFLIWNREVEDFILNISFRISPNGNSGIYYRSESGPEGYDDLLGYQADIDGQDTYTGIVYENFKERNRAVLARQGQLVRISEADSVQSFPFFTAGQSIKDYVKDGDWNDYELIVKGSVIVQKLNGNLVSTVEDKARNRVKKGLFGFQLHQGDPMKVEFKNAIFTDLSEIIR